MCVCVLAKLPLRAHVFLQVHLQAPEIFGKQVLLPIGRTGLPCSVARSPFGLLHVLLHGVHIRDDGKRGTYASRIKMH